jgi:hypothetical protein
MQPGKWDPGPLPQQAVHPDDLRPVAQVEQGAIWQRMDGPHLVIEPPFSLQGNPPPLHAASPSIAEPNTVRRCAGPYLPGATPHGM